MRVKFCHPQNRDCREKSREGGGGGGGWGYDSPSNSPRGACPPLAIRRALPGPARHFQKCSSTLYHFHIACMGRYPACPSPEPGEPSHFLRPVAPWWWGGGEIFFRKQPQHEAYVFYTGFTEAELMCGSEETLKCASSVSHESCQPTMQASR